MEANEKFMQFKALMDAITQMTPIHYKAYTDYIKMTNGNEELSRNLAKDLISAILTMNPRKKEGDE